MCVLLPSQGALANQLPQRQALSVTEVRVLLRQAVAEALARNAAATIAITDRVGNVLAVYQMPGADPTAVIDPGRPVVPPVGLAGAEVPSQAAAIAKAVTGAYLSSNGNAFTTRTASQIIQENFNPGSRGLEGGPLFGVQFSQLPCSDLAVRFESDNGGTIDRQIGPKRSPLGLAADPGGLPIYDQGTLVGAIGVMADGVYGLDRDIRGRDFSLDEVIALAAVRGFGAPSNLRANRVTVDGRQLRYVDGGDLRSTPADAEAVSLKTAGTYLAVTGYYLGNRPRAGQAFGFGASGFRPDPDDLFDSDQAYVLTTAAGVNRYPPIAGSGAGALTAAEVTELLTQALGVALKARGQIQRPLGNHAEVTISVVDVTGAILGIVRTPDGLLFGTDVSLQKARSAMFFSSPDVAADVASAPVTPGVTDPNSFIDATLAFLGPTSLDGDIAYSTRALGNIARPYYPDGVTGRNNGSLSLPFPSWSPFNTGLQLDLVIPNLLQHLSYVTGSGPDTAAQCANLPELADGLQIFSGGMPVYRNNQLVGGIGVSGDGIDQDGMIAFLGTDRARRVLGTGVRNAHTQIRADQLAPNGVRLRYVSCPFSPFLGSDQQNVCEGL